MNRVAFNGLGTMGSGMAMRLLGAGFEVTVYNRNPERAEPLRQAGARVASTPAEAAEGAVFIIAMVADDRASREVWTGSNGALAAAPADAVLIDSSTITPQWVRELSALSETHGCALLDAPVTGSRPQAQSGELLFLVGGPAEALERARPVLQPMSRGVVHLGPSGAGATMKLINNFVCGVQLAGLAEAMAWIERSGLERDQAVSILTGGAPASPLVKTLAERMRNRSYETNFRLDLMAKDLAYSHAEARQAGIELSTATTALARFEEAIRSGLGGSDLSAVVEAIRRSE
jgi:3-hydroxyisobutyrate dehydrogenase